jgi:hypothetical protein
MTARYGRLGSFVAPDEERMDDNGVACPTSFGGSLSGDCRVARQGINRLGNVGCGQPALLITSIKKIYISNR